MCMERHLHCTALASVPACPNIGARGEPGNEASTVFLTNLFTGEPNISDEFGFRQVQAVALLWPWFRVTSLFHSRYQYIKFQVKFIL